MSQSLKNEMFLVFKINATQYNQLYIYIVGYSLVYYEIGPLVNIFILGGSVLYSQKIV